MRSDGALQVDETGRPTWLPPPETRPCRASWLQKSRRLDGWFILVDHKYSIACSERYSGELNSSIFGNIIYSTQK